MAKTGDNKVQEEQSKDHIVTTGGIKIPKDEYTLELMGRGFDADEILVRYEQDRGVDWAKVQAEREGIEAVIAEETAFMADKKYFYTADKNTVYGKLADVELNSFKTNDFLREFVAFAKRFGFVFNGMKQITIRAGIDTYLVLHAIVSNIFEVDLGIELEDNEFRVMRK